MDETRASALFSCLIHRVGSFNSFGFVFPQAVENRRSHLDREHSPCRRGSREGGEFLVRLLSKQEQRMEALTQDKQVTSSVGKKKGKAIDASKAKNRHGIA